MQAIERIIHFLAPLFARIGGGIMMLIAFMVAIDVLTRNLNGQTYLNSFELSVYLFAIAISFGMSYTALSGAHIRVDVVLDRFPVAARRALDLLAFISLACVGAFFAYTTYLLFATSLRRGVTSTSMLAVPLSIPQAFLAVGMAIFALTALLLTARHAMLLLQGRGADADRVGKFDSNDEIAEAIEDVHRREAL